MILSKIKNEIWKCIYLLSLCIFLFKPVDLFAQLYGKVIDESTKEPLAGTNIYLAVSHIGTVSDEEGRFILSITGKLQSDTLVVNYLGYDEYRIALNEFENYSIISLRQKNLTLSESILIFAERMDLARQEIPHSRY